MARVREGDNGKVILAEHVVEELNVAMRWVAYPGVSNTTATTADLDFAPTT